MWIQYLPSYHSCLCEYTEEEEERKAQDMLHLVRAEKLVMMPHMEGSFLRDTQNMNFSKAIAKITIIIPKNQNCANLFFCSSYQILTLHFTSYSLQTYKSSV